jgi:hypothetical protein
MVSDVVTLHKSSRCDMWNIQHQKIRSFINLISMLMSQITVTMNTHILNIHVSTYSKSPSAVHAHVHDHLKVVQHYLQVAYQMMSTGLLPSQKL